jgi:hypothetical protein
MFREIGLKPAPIKACNTIRDFQSREILFPPFQSRRSRTIHHILDDLIVMGVPYLAFEPVHQPQLLHCVIENGFFPIAELFQLFERRWIVAQSVERNRLRREWFAGTTLEKMYSNTSFRRARRSEDVASGEKIEISSYCKMGRSGIPVESRAVSASNKKLTDSGD